jgi:tetratricopeptide (TPR) repeat protein
MEKIGNRRGEAIALGDLGNAHYALGKYPQAIDFYQQWLRIGQEIGDRPQQGNALGGLGNSHNALGQYAKAVDFYQQWLLICREVGDRRSEANALGGLGNAYNSLGEYSQAMEFHQQSLAIQREISDRLSETGTWSNFVETLAVLEQKTTNPYKSIESSLHDDSAIQQLVDANQISSKPKPKTTIKPTPPKKGWLGSTIDWITKGKK